VDEIRVHREQYESVFAVGCGQIARLEGLRREVQLFELGSYHLISLSRLKGFPFETALGTLERAVDVVIAGIAGTGVGLGQSHFIVLVGVLIAQTASTSRARSTCRFFAKPTLHGILLRKE
jgi:hypothetical protein